MANGTLEILNVGRGDVKISFDSTNAAEAIRAKRIIKDMLRRGYALLVEVDGKFSRVKEFDETAGEYVIADFDPEGDEPPSAEEIVNAQGKGKHGGRRVRMDRSTATGIGPTAGG